MKKTKKHILKFAFLSLVLGFVSTSHADNLSGAVRQAMKFNPDVLFAVTHRYTTNAQFEQAQADQYPVVDVSAGYGPEHSENPTSQSVTGGIPDALARREASVTLTQPIFRGFGITNEINRTREVMKSSIYKLQGVANDIALDVTEQYINVQRQQALVVIAQQNIAQHQQIMGMINDRTEAGIDREADLRQAQGRLALAKANLVAAKSFLDDASVKYTQLVGIPPRNLAKLAVPSFPIIPKSMQNGVRIAVANHPTLKSALEDVSAAIAQNQAAKSTNYPQLDFVASASRNRDLDGIIGDNNDASAMVKLNYNIFKGGKDFAHQRETAYEVQEAEEVKNRTLLQVEETMRLSWTALVNTDARLSYLASHVSAAQSTIDAYKEQFKAGKRSLFDLLDAQNELYQSENDLVSARYDELFARYRIINAMGKLIGYLHVTLPEAASLPFKDDVVAPLREQNIMVVRNYGK